MSSSFGLKSFKSGFWQWYVYFRWLATCSLVSAWDPLPPAVMSTDTHGLVEALEPNKNTQNLQGLVFLHSHCYSLTHAHMPSLLSGRWSKTFLPVLVFLHFTVAHNSCIQKMVCFSTNMLFNSLQEIGISWFSTFHCHVVSQDFSYQPYWWVQYRK